MAQKGRIDASRSAGGVDWPGLALRLPEWSAALTLAVAPLSAGSMQTLDEVPVILLTLLFCALPLGWALGSGRARLELFPGWQLAAALGAFTVISAISTVSPERTIPRMLELGCATAVFVTALRGGTGGRAALYGAAGAAAGATAVSLLGLSEYLAHLRAGQAGWRIFSSFYNPGFLAGFLAVCLPLTLCLAVRSEKRWTAALAGAACVLQTAALFLTGARAGLLAAGAGAAVLLTVAALGRALDRRSALRLLVIAAMCAAAAVAAGRPAGQRVQAAAQEGHSLEFRVYTWRGTLEMARERPLAGFGPGTFEVAFYPYTIAGYTRLAHSTWLQTAAESGLGAGLALAAGWAWLWGAAVWRAVRRQADGDGAWLVAGCGAAMAATTVRGVFDSDWWCLPILLVAALCAGHLARSCPEEGATEGAWRAPGWGLAGAAAAGVILTLMLQRGLTAASAAEEAERGGDPASARQAWRAAAAWMPWSVSARLAALMYDAAGGIPEDFEAAIGRLQKLEPTNPKIPHAAAAAFERHGLRDRQIVWLEKARSLDPHSPRLLLEHARALEAAGREDEAVQCWAEMVAVEFSPYGRVLALPQMVEPSYAFAHAALGRRAEQRGREWRARRHYRRAVEILERYFSSLEQMRPVLEAGGLADPRLEQEARSVLLEVRQALKRLPDTPGPERRGPGGWVPGPPPSRRP